MTVPKFTSTYGIEAVEDAMHAALMEVPARYTAIRSAAFKALATITDLQARVTAAEAWAKEQYATADRYAAQLAASQAEVARLCDYIVECDDHAANEIPTLRADLAACKSAMATMAVRFDHCADMIAESHAISGTLRAERTIKARHYALEARAIVEPDKQPEDDVLVEEDQEDPLVAVFELWSRTPGSADWCGHARRAAAFRKTLAARGLSVKGDGKP